MNEGVYMNDVKWESDGTELIGVTQTFRIGPGSGD